MLSMKIRIMSFIFLSMLFTIPAYAGCVIPSFIVIGKSYIFSLMKKRYIKLNQNPLANSR